MLFLREHNRIARELSAANDGWDDEQLFQTARNVLIVLLLKIVVEEYIHHISAAHFQPRLAPHSFPNEPWYRPNWMTIEFNLLYRWHSLAPSTLHLNGTSLTIARLAVRHDAAHRPRASARSWPRRRASRPVASACSTRTSGSSSTVEMPSIEQARKAELCSYNDYRRLCRYPPATTWEEISSDEETQDRLRDVYGDDIDKVELYVGLFAEDTHAQRCAAAAHEHDGGVRRVLPGVDEPAARAPGLRPGDVLEGRLEDHRGDQAACRTS